MILTIITLCALRRIMPLYFQTVPSNCAVKFCQQGAMTADALYH